MTLPARNVLEAFRRFVGLRSAWRRSLAMEPGEAPPRGCSGPRPPRDCESADGAPHRPVCRAGGCQV
jgi:hypothetical protein